MTGMRLTTISIFAAVFLGVALHLLPPRSCDPLSSCNAAEVADLKEQLEKGLRATRPDQAAFIDKIVKLVAQDRLPRRIVNASFSWARKRRPSYHFPFFERALRILAAREGIKI